MKLLVFGENGQVARCLADEATGDVALVTAGRAAADLMRAGAGAALIAELSPDIIVNAAAYTAVDKAETERDAARRLNAEAAGEVAAAAKAADAGFIHISSDYVFDGTGEEPYHEEDSTAPLGVYGETKLEGERAVMAAHPGAVIIRTSWVFSEYGANFVKTMLRLAATRDEVGVVADQVGGPTPARDIAHVILMIAGKKHRGATGEGVYHYQGAPHASWADFAEKIFELAGTKTVVKRITTAEFPTPAKRPAMSLLNCAQIERDFGVSQPDWRIALADVIAALELQGMKE